MTRHNTRKVESARPLTGDTNPLPSTLSKNTSSTNSEAGVPSQQTSQPQISKRASGGSQPNSNKYTEAAASQKLACSAQACVWASKLGVCGGVIGLIGAPPQTTPKPHTFQKIGMLSPSLCLGFKNSERAARARRFTVFTYVRASHKADIPGQSAITKRASGGSQPNSNKYTEALPLKNRHAHPELASGLQNSEPAAGSLA